jgi:hypothetical protein
MTQTADENTKGSPMKDNKAWLEETASRAKKLSKAYKRTLDRLWWANLLFVVVPAVLTTGAAVFAALPPERALLFNLPVASVFAGLAAILITIHKALKCDDYQVECLRLSQAYQGIAIDAHSAAATPGDDPNSPQTRLTRELVELTKSAKAQVRSNFMSQVT